MAAFFFFQAEDGIRDRNVTGVQTCALPISSTRWRSTRQPWLSALLTHRKRGTLSLFCAVERRKRFSQDMALGFRDPVGPGRWDLLTRAHRRILEIGRASCRERV